MRARCWGLPIASTCCIPALDTCRPTPEHPSSTLPPIHVPLPRAQTLSTTTRSHGAHGDRRHGP